MLKSLVRRSLFKFLYNRGYGVIDINKPPIETSPSDARIIDAVRPYTMTSVDRIWAFLNAVAYVVRKPIEGAIVECGVWRGGSMMAAAMRLLKAKEVRDLYLFDTFAGMTKPTDVDRSSGEAAMSKWETSQRESHNEWAFSSLGEVRRNVLSTGYPLDRIRFVQGPVEQTLRVSENIPSKIALLRLDTDWYESTKVELEVLYPRLAHGGVLIIDDFGDWEGSQKATLEYIQNNDLRLLLTKVDDSCRMSVKV